MSFVIGHGDYVDVGFTTFNQMLCFEKEWKIETPYLLYQGKKCAFFKKAAESVSLSQVQQQNSLFKK